MSLFNALDRATEMILKVKGKVKGIFILSPYIMEPNSDDMMRARMNEYVAICKKLAEKPISEIEI